MGLLDTTANDWLELYRRAAQNRAADDWDADFTHDREPSWLPQAPLAPLSFAGPGLAANRRAPARGQARTTVPLPRPRPIEAATADVSWPNAPVEPLRMPPSESSASPPGWAQAPTGNPLTGSRRLTAQNLTAHALRMRDVPEADIAAAINNPGLMRQLVNQHFGPGGLQRQDDRALNSAPRGTPIEAQAGPSWGDIGSDILHSGLSGIERGGIGVFGMAGDLRDIASEATDYLGAKFSIDPEKIDQLKHVGSRISHATHLSDAPNSADIRSAVEGVIGPLYEPKTGYGRVAQTMGELAPNLVGGSGTLVPKLLTKVVAPALATEGAGYLARGTEYEPLARITGAMAGGAGAGRLEREIKNAAIPQVVRELDEAVLNRSPLGGTRLNSKAPPLEDSKEALHAAIDEYLSRRRERAWEEETKTDLSR